MKRTPLRARPPVDRGAEPGRKEWKAPAWGACQVCGVPGLLLRHHVVLEQHVRRAGGDPWDLANALALGYYGCACHREHHHCVRRIAITCLPDAAVGFAIDLLGEDAAVEYLRRYYR